MGGGVLVYPLRLELRIDGVGGRNVIQLHYEYIFCLAVKKIHKNPLIFYYFLLPFCKRLWYTYSKLKKNFSAQRRFLKER